MLGAHVGEEGADEVRLRVPKTAVVKVVRVEEGLWRWVGFGEGEGLDLD